MRGFVLILICLLQVCSFEVSWVHAKPRETRAELLLRKFRDPDDPHVMVAAHRGDWRNAPENSLQAIQNCIDMGVDIVEIDIRVTKDNEFVLMHDKTLERTTNGKGKVSHHTLEEIKELRLLNGYGLITEHPVPTLQDAISLCKDRILVYVDKSERQIARVYEVARQFGTAEQTLFYGSKPAAELKSELGKLAERINYLPKLSQTHSQEYLAGFKKQMKLPAFIVHSDSESSFPFTQMLAIRKNGMRVWASPLWPELCAGYTDDLAVRDPDGSWGKLIQHGANILCTDRPALLLRYLRAKGLHD